MKEIENNNHTNKLFPENWKIKYLLSLIILILIGLLGSATPIPINSEVQSEIKEAIDDILSKTPTVNLIFFNNTRIALLMMLPIVGIIITISSIYITGVAFSFIGNEVNISGTELYILTAMTPFFWLEFLSYAASFMYAFYISKMLILYIISYLRSRFYQQSIVKRNINIYQIIRPTMLVISLIVSLLYLGAIVEMYFIESYESL